MLLEMRVLTQYLRALINKSQICRGRLDERGRLVEGGRSIESLR